MLSESLNREVVVVGPVERIWAVLAARARTELAAVRVPPPIAGAHIGGRPGPDRGCELLLRFLEEDATALSMRCIFGGSAGLRRMHAECDISVRAGGDDRTAIALSMRVRDSSRDAEGAQALLDDVLERLTRSVHQSAQQLATVGPGQPTTGPTSVPGSAVVPACGVGPGHRTGSRAAHFLLGYVVTRELLRWRSR